MCVKGNMYESTDCTLHADVSVELALCCLLLGDSEKAEDILGLGPDSPPEQADPSIKTFVMVCVRTKQSGIARNVMLFALADLVIHCSFALNDLML